MSLHLQSQVLGTACVDIDCQLQELIEKILRLQVNPFQFVIVVEGAEFHALQAHGRDYLAEHLSHQLQKDVIWVQDGMNNGIDRYYIGPLETFIAGNRMLISIDGRAVLVHKPLARVVSSVTQTRNTRAKVKISRPPNSYILYRKDHHKIIKASNPAYTNNQISKVLGQAWKQEKADVRSRYKKMAEELKQNLLRAHPDYRYAPRRPGERRRRARRARVEPTESIHEDTEGHL
ncbi:hypothetical protein ACHAQH_004815 [Verticillium albo-atrum]